MITRSPPLTRQRTRQQQQQNEELENLERPNNTANQQNRNVLQISRSDPGILEQRMDTTQIENALLHISPQNRQNGQNQVQNVTGNGGNADDQHGEQWQIRDGNLFDGHRIMQHAPPNIVVRTSTPNRNHTNPESHTDHAVENRPNNGNFTQIFQRGPNRAVGQQQEMPGMPAPQLIQTMAQPLMPMQQMQQPVHQPIVQPYPSQQMMMQQPIVQQMAMQQPIQQPMVAQTVAQQGMPGFNWGYTGQLPYFPPTSVYPPQQNFAYTNTNPQQPPQMQQVPHYPPPIVMAGEYRTAAFSQQPNANHEYHPTENQNRGPGMDQVAYALIMNQIPSLRGNEGADKIKEFFKRFDSNTAEWSNAKRITSLESKIFGRAERAFKSACSSEPYRYESIKREMLRQLEETDSREWSAFDQLMTGVRRKSDEDLDTLAERIINLVRRAYPGLTDHLVDDYAIKHLIRTFDNSELALSLEMGRTPGMTFDRFVGIAARAEATQKATRRMAAQNSYYKNQTETRAPNTFSNNYQANDNRPKCYNCGKIGHVSRNCFSRQADQSGQGRITEPNQSATGANRTPMSNNSNTNFTRRPEQNVASQNRPQQFQSRNFLKQNFLIEQKEDTKHDEADVKCAGVMSNEPEMLELFRKFWAEHDEKLESEDGKEASPIGRIMAINVKIFDHPAVSMLDSGAQVSLIKAEFLKEILKSQKMETQNLNICPKTRNVIDINGKRVDCYGVISLPVTRRGCEAVEITFHITEAPVGLPILFGTNAWGHLGFKIFDAPNGELFEFDCVDSKSDSVRIIYKTVVEPRSSKFVELSLPANLNGKNVVISQKDENSKVRVEASLDNGRNDKVGAAIANFSQKAVILKEKKQFVTAEITEKVVEADVSRKFDSFLHKFSTSYEIVKKELEMTRSLSPNGKEVEKMTDRYWGKTLVTDKGKGKFCADGAKKKRMKRRHKHCKDFRPMAQTVDDKREMGNEKMNQQKAKSLNQAMVGTLKSVRAESVDKKGAGGKQISSRIQRGKNAGDEAEILTERDRRGMDTEEASWSKMVHRYAQCVSNKVKMKLKEIKEHGSNKSSGTMKVSEGRERMDKNGRSLVEIWRFGDTFDKTRVRADGRTLSDGLKCLRAWIFTQIPNFPDDNALGIRRPSRPILSVSHQLSEISLNSPHSSRSHPYARRSQYDARGRRDDRQHVSRHRH